MVSKVSERPSYTIPSPGSESSFIAQLLQTTQQHGYAINQLIGLLETGTFTPTLTFATPGDLSVVYTVQVGRFIRLGDLVHYILDVAATPTFTTASGILALPGLPYAAAATPAANAGTAVVDGASVTYPTGRTGLAAWLATAASELNVVAQGSATGITRLVAADVASGSAVRIRLQGFYPTDDVEGF